MPVVFALRNGAERHFGLLATINPGVIGVPAREIVD